MHDPSISHWKAVKRIFLYLSGTVNYVIYFTKGNYLKLTAFSGSDWTGNKTLITIRVDFVTRDSIC